MAVHNKNSNNLPNLNKAPDKHKSWLILGITIAILIVLFLVLYSPVREALFGKVIKEPSFQQAPIELTRPEICNDGIDNDGDNRVDCSDSDCSGKVFDTLTLPTGQTQNLYCPLETEDPDGCSNEIDDDGDSLIDCADSDCINDPACETAAVLGDSDSNGCLSITEYTDFKYNYKNGLLPDVDINQYTDLKYEFKNNLNNIVC